MHLGLRPASMMLPGTKAFHCLAATFVRPGGMVLVHGAAGAVGRFATQFATIAGAHVVGTVSEKNFDLLRNWGATPVLRGTGLAERVQAAAVARLLPSSILSEPTR